MINCFVQFHERRKSLMFYDSRKHQVQEVVALSSSNYFTEAVLKIRRKQSLKRFVVCFGMRRFSLARLSALFGNIVADTRKSKLASLLVPEDAGPSELVRIFETSKLQWKSAIEPSYIFELHITQRKKR